MRRDATIHSIQLLRSIAATLVAVFHAQQAFANHVSATVFANERYVFGFGAVGVHIFFVISGFIMVLTSCRTDRPFNAAGFFRRRFARIYPMYWLTAVAYLIAHLAIGQPYDLSAGQIVGALLLWPESASLIIGPAWTLSYEMYFYLVFGLAMTVGMTRGLIALGAFFIVSIAIGRFFALADPGLLLATNTLLLEFLAGTAIGWLTLTQRLPKRGNALIVVLGIALFGAGLFYGYHRLPSALVWGVPSTLVVLGLVGWEYRKGSSRHLRRWARLGDSSYLLYLIHILIITLCITASKMIGAPYALSPPAAGIVVAIIAIVVAEVVHRKVERPMLKWLNPGSRSSRAETLTDPDRSAPEAQNG